MISLPSNIILFIYNGPSESLDKHVELFLFRPEILKQEIKVFFVKYNDPIYVKLEKLDIMIRLASQANIAQVLTSRSWGGSCSCAAVLDWSSTLKTRPIHVRWV